MADIQQLKQALVRADRAGDTEAANLFARKIKEMQSTPVPAAPPAPSESGVPLAGAVPMKFTEGATMGFADELSGGLAAAMSYPASMVSDRIAGETEGMGLGDRYEMYRDRERERLGQISQERPVTSAVSQLAGGVAGAAIPAQKGLTMFKGGQTIPQMMRAGAVEGSVYGGVNALGQSDELDAQAAKETALGAGLGAAAGGVTPAVTQPLSGAASAFAQRFKPAYEQAAGRVSNALGKARMDGTDVGNKMASLGDDAMLVDALGTPGRSLGRSAINASPEAEDILVGRATARQGAMPDRMTAKLLEASGLKQPMTTPELQDQIGSQMQPAITRAYESARQAGFDIPTQPFDDLMQIPMVASAAKKAADSQKNYLPGQGDVGQLGFLNEVKKQLDNVASTADRSGDTLTRNQARDLAKELRTRIDVNTPEYAGARGLAQQKFALQDAVDLGSQGAKPTVANDFARNIAALDEGAQNAAAQGYAGAKISQIENRRATPGAVDAMFGTNRSQEALGAALGKRASIVDEQIARERAFGTTQKELTGGSTTAKQLAALGGGGALGGLGLGAATGNDPTTSALAGIGIGVGARGGQRLLQMAGASNEARVAPIVAEILSGRELPAAVIEHIKRTPAIQAAIARAVAMNTSN